MSVSGVKEKAADCMKEFYSRKYSLPPGEPPVSDDLTRAIKVKHSVPAIPITPEEVQEALSHSRPNTASGHDSVCYAAIQTFFAKDTSGKLVGFFDDILSA